MTERLPNAPVLAPIWSHVNQRGTQIAAIDPRAEISYAQLRNEITILTERLGAVGIGPNIPVLLLPDICVESIVAYWALRALDAVVVVGDPGASAAEVEYFCHVSGATHILAGHRAAGSVRPPAGCAWHVLSDHSGNGLRSWRIGRHSHDQKVPSVSLATECAVILFSSGTTGKPKAIMHSRASVFALHETLLATWKLYPGDRVLGALPLHTIYGLLFSAGSALHAGATLVLLDRYHAHAALEAIQKHMITTAAFVPAMVRTMLKLPERSEFALSSLRMAYTASAPISDEEVSQFRNFAGAPLLSNYGMTEIPGAAVEPAGEAHVEGCVGKISPGFAAVARAADGTPLPPGEHGEITLRGPSQMMGYLRDPEQTAQRVRNGWIYTQDIGRIDHEGNIFLSGRISEFINRGGLNISPVEIENILLQHPAVADCAVVAATDRILGQVPFAFVVTNRDDEIDTLLRQHCRENLSPVKIPESFVPIAYIPRNAGGKILRRELEERAMQLYEPRSVRT